MCRCVYVEERLDSLGAVGRKCHRAAPHLPSCVEQSVSQHLAMFARHGSYQSWLVQMSAAAPSCLHMNNASQASLIETMLNKQPLLLPDKFCGGRPVRQVFHHRTADMEQSCAVLLHCTQCQVTGFAWKSPSLLQGLLASSCTTSHGKMQWPHAAHHMYRQCRICPALCITRYTGLMHPHYVRFVRLRTRLHQGTTQLLMSCS